MTAVDYRAILEDLDSKILELQTVRSVIAQMIGDAAAPPPKPENRFGPMPEKKKRKYTKKPVEKKERKPAGGRHGFAELAPLARKIGTQNPELNEFQLKERFGDKLPMSPETIRAILRNTAHHDPDYDPTEWISYHSARKP
jgi:hypothetical protein